MRTFLKKMAILLTGVLTAVLLILFILYKRGDIHRHAQTALVHILKNNLAGEIDLGTISGSILQTIQFSGVRIYQGADTLLQADTLRCQWQPLGLLRGRLAIDRLEVRGARISLHQFDDQSWNYKRFLKASEQTSPTEGMVILNAIHLRDTSLKLQLAGSLEGTQQITLPVMEASALFSPARWQIDLTRCEAEVEPLDLVITRLQAKAEGDGENLHLTALYLDTPASRLSGSMHAKLAPKLQFDIKLRLDSLAAIDIQPFTDHSLPFKKARADLLAAGNADSITIDLHADAREGSAQVSGWIKPARAAAGNIRLSDVLTDSLLQLPGKLDAAFTFSGKDLTSGPGHWQTDGWLHHTLFDAYALKPAQLSVIFGRKQVRLSVRAPGSMGTLDASGMIELGTDPLYDLRIGISGLNLAALTAQPALASALNLDLRLRGRGLDLNRRFSQASLRVHPFEIAGAAVDSLFAEAKVRRSEVVLDTLQLSAPGLKTEGYGRWQVQGPLSLVFHTTLAQHRTFASWLNADSLKLNGTVTGILAGTPDSLVLEATARLHDCAYDAFVFREITATLAAVTGEHTHASLNLISGAIRSDEKNLAKSLELSGRLDGNDLFAEAALAINDSLAAHSALQAEKQDSLWRIILPQLAVTHRRQVWQLEGASPQLTLQPNRLHLSELILANAGQRLTMGGTLDLSDTLQFHIDLENMDITEWSHFVPGAAALEGALSWHTTLTGIASHPRIVTSIFAEKIKLPELPTASLQFSSLLQDSLLNWDGVLTQEGGNSVHFSGLLPLRLRWPLPHALLADTDSIDIAVRTRNLQAGILSPFISGLDLKGSLSGDLVLRNTWQNPQPDGYLELRNGSLRAPFIGKAYKPIEARLELEPSRVLLRRFRASSGEGYLTGDGYGAYHLDKGGLKFNELSLRLKADHFTAADGNEITLVVDGALEVADKLAEPRIHGAMRVERARIDLAAFTETPSTLLQADQPLLIVTRDDTTSASYDRKILMPSWMPMFERMRGSVKLEFPRNTWLRSPEMNIEIAGNLDLAKEGDDFGLFGSIQIVRGNYDLFSRRFDIQEGTLTFTGGDNLPEMTLQADHNFRSLDKIKHTLSFTASGELRKPLFSFTLDGLSITEVDAVSYLAFGRSFTDLTHGQKSDLISNQLQMSSTAFKQLLTGQIASEVTRSLQQTLNLDVIEFRGDQNWRQSTVVVGKYLTNDLYVSYERQLNLGRSNEVVPEQMTLEYEILPSLFLQATRGEKADTGFDLIYKWEK